MENEEAIILGRTGDETGSKLAYLGKEYIDGALGAKVYLDLSLSHRIMVFGQTGQGKSYTLGVLAEEVTDNKAGDVLVLDPLSVFWALTKPNDKAEIEKHWGVRAKKYQASLFALKGCLLTGFTDVVTEFAFHGHELAVDEILRVLKIDPVTQMANAIQTGIIRISDRIERGLQKKGYSLDDIERETFRGYREVIHPSTRNALRARFLTTKSWRIFDTRYPSLEDVVSHKGLSVLLAGWVRHLGKDLPHSTLFEILGDAVIRARYRLIEQEYFGRMERLQAGDEVKQQPSWLILDEARDFVPPNKSTRTREIIERWVEQGRNYRASIAVATQSPELIDERVIAQSDIVISHRLKTHDNIRSLTERIRGLPPSVVRGLLEDLPAQPGFAVVFEDTMDAPLAIKIRNRKSFHPG
jgi:DNA helicase HerA-like ATPase